MALSILNEDEHHLFNELKLALERIEVRQKQTNKRLYLLIEKLGYEKEMLELMESDSAK